MQETPRPTFSELRTVLQLAHDTAIDETGRVREKLAQNQKPWNREHSDFTAYDATFSNVLPDGVAITLREMKKRKKPGEPFVVVDLMGTGSVFARLPEYAKPDIIIAITLVDYRTQQQKEEDEKKGIYVIGTDKDDLSQVYTSVALPSTWKRFDNLLKSLGIENIHFAIARPLGGMRTIPAEHLWFLSWMVQKVYRHLSPNKGMLITEAPQNQNTALLQWEEEARQRGLDVLCRLITKDRGYQPIRTAVKIIKHPDSPSVIP